MIMKRVFLSLIFLFPAVTSAQWSVFDAFVYTHLQTAGLTPAPAVGEVKVSVGQPRMIFRGGQSPVLVQLGNGWIVADVASRTGKVHAGRSRSAVISKDRGQTWQPWPESTRTSNDGTRIVLSAGTAIALSQRSERVSDREYLFTGFRWYSTDHWQTVLGPDATEIRLPDFAAGDSDGGATTGPYFFGRALESPDGSMLATMYTNFTPDRKYQPKPGKRLPWRTILVRSNDLGKTWDYYSTVACQDSIKDANVRKNWQQGFGEPALEKLPDGKMICVMRTGASAGTKTIEAYSDLAVTAVRDGKYVVSDGSVTPNLYMATSTDEGKTWTEPRPIPGARSVCPRLLLLENGVLALSFGRTYRPKQGNSLMFSTDGGTTWSQRFDIYPGLSSGYTDITPIGSDRLLYVYDVVSNDPIGSSNWEQNWVCAVDIQFRFTKAQ